MSGRSSWEINAELNCLEDGSSERPSSDIPRGAWIPGKYNFFYYKINTDNNIFFCYTESRIATIFMTLMDSIISINSSLNERKNNMET